MKIIYLTGRTDKRPRKEIWVDDFSFTVTTTGGDALVTLPGGRTYDVTNDYLNVYANGIKLVAGREYTRSSDTTITAVANAMFPDGKFPKNCILDFELFLLN